MLANHYRQAGIRHRVATKQLGNGRTTAAKFHTLHLRVRAQLEHLKGHIGQAVDIVRAVDELVRIVLGVGKHAGQIIKR